MLIGTFHLGGRVSVVSLRGGFSWRLAVDHLLLYNKVPAFLNRRIITLGLFS